MPLPFVIHPPGAPGPRDFLTVRTRAGKSPWLFAPVAPRPIHPPTAPGPRDRIRVMAPKRR